MTGVDPLLPAPAWRSAGDYVFVSTVHPVRPDGALAIPDGLSPWVGESQVFAQSLACLEELDRRLVAAGSGLDRLLRVEVFLAESEDLREYLVASRSVFGLDPPPRTTVVVGDEQLLAGGRVSMHAVGFVGDVDRITTVRTVFGQDVTQVEHAAAARAAGDFVFCSGFPATDHSNGLAVHPPTNSYHNSGAAAQARHVVDSLTDVLKQIGSSLDRALRVHFYEPDLTTFEAVDAVWGDAVGVPPARSSMACRDLTIPGAMFAANLWTLTGDTSLTKSESRDGIPWHPVEIGRANFSPGIRAGDWFFTSGQIPVPDLVAGVHVGAPPGLPNHFDDAEVQTVATLDMLREQIEANGYVFEDVVEARVHLVNPRRDFRGFARAWDRAFGGLSTRPALSVIPSAQRNGDDGVLIRGPKLEIEFTCHRSAG